MPSNRVPDTVLMDAVRMYKDCGCSKKAAAEAMSVPRTTMRRWLKQAAERGLHDPEGLRQRVIRRQLADGSIQVSTEPQLHTGKIRAYFEDSKGMRHVGLCSEEDLRAAANIPDDYTTEYIRPNSWPAQDALGAMVFHQIRATFKPPPQALLRLEELLSELRESSPVVPLRHAAQPAGGRVCVEISIMDPHHGLRSNGYDIDLSSGLYKWATQTLLKMSLAYGTPAKILFPFGNDYLHAEHTHATTKGTPQPEMDGWHGAYIQGERLAIDTVEWLSKTAPVHVLSVPGNHDRHSSFTLARVLLNRFHNDENVTVDADPGLRKYYRWGVNLLGFDHGKTDLKTLPMLMANECRDDWAHVRYKEWHLGDQHRKGTIPPTAFETQGVAYEYLPSFVVPNTWHSDMAYNWQQRGAMAFVWDEDRGPLARLQVNLDSYSGEPLGAAA